MIEKARRQMKEYKTGETGRYQPLSELFAYIA
jgi:hypothetical protein